MTLLLAGVAVGELLGAVTSGLLTFMNEQKTAAISFSGWLADLTTELGSMYIWQLAPVKYWCDK